jgi:hypothetical protein
LAGKKGLHIPWPVVHPRWQVKNETFLSKRLAIWLQVVVDTQQKLLNGC